MRVQLQQHSGGRTIHHRFQVLSADDGVRTGQLAFALRRLRSDPVIPKREQGRADSALAHAVRWVEARPPAGVCGRFAKSFYFDPLNPGESWRFDIEGLSGYNLQR